MENVVLEISDFLGFCDLNGVDAINTEQVQKLEEFIKSANNAHNSGEELIADAIYDRLMEILRKVNPESELCKYIWEDSVDEFDDTDTIVKNNPMYSIQTVKSYDCDELKNYVDRLPEDTLFDAHVSVKLNGHGVRLKFQKGNFIQAKSRARSSSGRDITKPLRVCLEKNNLTTIDEISGFDLCEVRGEWVLPFVNVDAARSYNPDIKSAFSGVASMGRDSASDEEYALLDFVAYEFIGEGMNFTTKEEEYSFLEDLGFKVPASWVINDLSKDTLIEDLKGIVSDCEEEIKPDEYGNNGYEYYTDGLVFTINNYDLFRQLGDDGSHYKFGNIALKVGYWEQNILCGYVQTILWTKGKSKLSPVAIVADEPDVIEFNDEEYDLSYIFDKKDVVTSCWNNRLGVLSVSGNKVRRVPLYEPNNIMVLDAYPGEILHFRYGGEAGVVPCFEDGTPLLDGRVQSMLENEDYIDADDEGYFL